MIKVSLLVGDSRITCLMKETLTMEEDKSVHLFSVLDTTENLLDLSQVPKTVWPPTIFLLPTKASVSMLGSLSLGFQVAEIMLWPECVIHAIKVTVCT